MSSILQENEFNIDKIIENKKLQLNYIWSNKITQEDINHPRKLDSNEENLKLMKIILNSVMKIVKKIISLFEDIFDGNFEIFYMEDKAKKLVLLSSALIQKLKNFVDVKTRTFKPEKSFIDDMVKVLDYYKLIKSNLQNFEISRKFIEINDSLVEYSDIIFGE